MEAERKPSWVGFSGIVLALAAVFIVASNWPARGADFTVAQLEAALADKPDGAKVDLLPENSFTGQPIKSVINVGGVVQIVGGRADEPEPVAMLSPFGMYQALQPGAHAPPSDLSPPRGNRLISAAQLKLEPVIGFTCRVRPHWMGASDPTNFSFIDANLARANSTGDVMNLLVMSGAEKNTLSEDTLRWFEIAAARLGERYNGKPGLAGIHVTGASSPGASEEQHWPKVTPEVLVANGRVMKAWANAFPDHWLIYAIGGADFEGKKKLIDALARIAPGRVCIKHNSLKASSSIDADHFKLLAYAISKNLRVGFEMVGDSKDVSRFGPGGVMAGINRGVQFLNRHNYKPQDAYWAIYPTDLAALRAVQ